MFTSLKTKTLAMAAGAVVLGGIGTSTVVGAQTTDDDATTEVESTDNTEQSDNNTEQSDNNTEQSEREGRSDRGEDGHRGGCGKSLETMAGIIGIEPEELQAALEDGQSLADVAEANGVEPDELVDALIAEAEEKVEAKVEAGRLTEAEGAEKLAEKTDRIEDRVAGVDQADKNEDEAAEGEGS